MATALSSALSLTQTGTNDGTIAWDFSVGNDLTQYLAAGETVTVTYTITVTDDSGTGNNSTTQDVTVVITGTNDTPVITGGPDTSSLTETDSGLTDSGVLAVSDADQTDIVSAAVNSVIVSGTGSTSVPSSLNNATLQSFLTVTPAAIVDGTELTNNLNLELHSGSEAFDFLATDETLILTYTVSATDDAGTPLSDTETVTVTITGTNDAPVISGGPDTSSLTETDSGLTDSGALTVSDSDLTDVVTAAVDSVIVSGTGSTSVPSSLNNATLQSFLTVTPAAILDGTIITNTLTWNFNSGSEAFDFLATGETLILTYTVSATDDAGTPLSDTETVTVTITGTNDAPVITGGPNTSSLTETDDGLIDTGTLTVSDADLTDNITAAVDSVLVSGTGSGSVPSSLDNSTLRNFLNVSPAAIIDGAETTDVLTWTFDSGSEAFDFLATGDTLILTYTVTAADDDGTPLSDTETVTVTITGTNDGPQATNLSGTEAYTEDVAINLVDIVTSDIDDGDLRVTLTLSDTTVGSLNTATSGSVTSTFTDGVWTASGAIADVNTLLAALTFSPATDYDSDFSIATSVDDGEAPAITGVIDFIATPVNDAPNLTINGATVLENSLGNTLTTAMINAVDVDDAPTDLTYTIVSNVSAGSLTATTGGLSATLSVGDTFTQADIDNGIISYNHSGSESATDSFDVELSDGGEDGVATQRGTFIFDISPVNDAPTAIDDSYTITEDSSLSPTTGVDSLLQNDSDPEGDLLTVDTTPVSGPENGTLVLNTDGTFTYTPDPDFSGTDSFSYEISDGNGGIAQANVEIAVEARNDSPVLTTTLSSTLTVAEDSGATSLGLGLLDYSQGGGADEASQILTFNVTNLPSGIGTIIRANGVEVTNGSYTLAEIQGMSFVPTANAVGTGVFQFEVVDDGGTDHPGEVDTLVQQIAIEVTPVNDAPTTSPVDLAAIAEDSGVRTITQAELLANANDVEGDPLTATDLTISSGNGTLVGNGDRTWNYTAVANDDSEVSFSYNITDGTTQVAGNATLDITPVNDAPTTFTVTLTAVAEDSGPRLITQAELLGNATDIEGNALTAADLTISSGNGTLVDIGDGTWNYLPAANDDSDVSFSYTITDGTTIVAGNATLDIVPVNDAPTNLTPTLINVPENTDTTDGLMVATLTASDIEDGDNLSYTIIDGEDSAKFTIVGDQLVFSDGLLNFEAKPNYSVAILVTDSDGATLTEVVLLNVEDRNDAPVATDDTLQTAESTAMTGDVLANDFDEDNDTLTTTLTLAPINAASFTLNADGSFSYVPITDFYGTDSFEYSVSDGNGGTDTAIANITVTRVNDITIPQSDSFQILPGQSNSSVVSVLANDINIDGDALVAVLVDAPTNGTLILGADGNFVYTPNAGFTGQDTFTYVANDGFGNSVAATVVLETSAGATPPVNPPEVASCTRTIGRTSRARRARQ